MDTLIKQIAITDIADTPIMDQGDWFKTAPTARQFGGKWLQDERQGVFGVLAAGYDRVAWPESGKINRIHGDIRVQGVVCLATANLPASLTVNPLFPTIPRRTLI
ncbi:MAG: hypothetical protein A3J24_03445 [Deltaproteobacteria bacterium RIFCSPLOWO2_02_FULL_53_8]|nr:MAG: hypothetical protein A3J24_03445 [Deltaproteobacteria bacterium RIFCSPLOWO2_02_FULL_53_8]